MYNIATVTQLTALARLATRIVYVYYRSLLMNDKTETMRPARTVQFLEQTSRNCSIER